MSYTRMHAFTQNWIGKGFLFAIVALFAWHAVHRILCSLHDVGIHKTLMVKLVCYGAAMAITLVAAVCLISIGF
jgi:fumarate reductase subunit D